PPPSLPAAAPGFVGGAVAGGYAGGGRGGGFVGVRGALPDTESYASIEENKFRRPVDQPLSTLSIDVDTASYANVRRFLNDGRLPPVDAVRDEELINYFHFDYAHATQAAPF